jgi:hypothetical protein
VKVPGWSVAGRKWVEVGNRIIWRMIRLPNGETHGGEPDPDPLRLWFASSGVGDGGFALWYGVIDRSLIVRSAVPLVRGSTTDDPLS